MRANVLPWLLVAVVVGAWLGATFLGGEVESGAVDVIGAEDEGAVRAELAALRLEVGRLEKTVSDLQQAQPATLEGRTAESTARLPRFRAIESPIPRPRSRSATST